MTPPPPWRVVKQNGGDYGPLSLVRDQLAGASAAERDAIFGETALAVFPVRG